jgi:hypothetical protein
MTSAAAARRQDVRREMQRLRRSIAARSHGEQQAPGSKQSMQASKQRRD